MLNEEPAVDRHGFVFLVRTQQGHQRMKEHELLSCDGGLSALSNFRDAIKPGRKEPTDVSNGPVVGDRLSVYMSGAWQMCTVEMVHTTAADGQYLKRPEYTVLYSDGMRVRDRLKLPWQIRSSSHGKRKTDASATTPMKQAKPKLHDLGCTGQFSPVFSARVHRYSYLFFQLIRRKVRGCSARTA